jgi:hypothetical protein
MPGGHLNADCPVADCSSFSDLFPQTPHALIHCATPVNVARLTCRTVYANHANHARTAWRRARRLPAHPLTPIFIYAIVKAMKPGSIAQVV